MRKAGKKVAMIIGKIVIGLVVSIIVLFGIMKIIRAQQSKIRTDNKIQESKMITLGGISQYIQIRGEDQQNPVVIFLHGGPGNPISYVSSYMQKGLEDDFTFIHWDQRGCGKSYYANPDDLVTIDLLMSDLDELVDYVRERFQQEKVVIMGHSWGTVLGTKYCKTHPEKVLSYIGIGQVVDINKGEVLAAKEAMLRATQQGKEEDVQKMNEYIEIFNTRGDYEHLDWNCFVSLRDLTGKYLSPSNGMNFLQMAYIGLFDPGMNIDEFRWFLTANNTEKLAKIECNLQEYMFDHFKLEELGFSYEVPVYFISGDSDWCTPYVLVQNFYEELEAPKKQMFMIKGAGHATYMDNQEGFCEAMEVIKEEISCLK